MYKLQRCQLGNFCDGSENRRTDCLTILRTRDSKMLRHFLEARSQNGHPNCEKLSSFLIFFVYHEQDDFFNKIVPIEDPVNCSETLLLGSLQQTAAGWSITSPDLNTECVAP